MQINIEVIFHEFVLYTKLNICNIQINFRDCFNILITCLLHVHAK